MRVATAIPVSLEMDSYPAPVLSALTADLGVSGVCVETPAPLDGASVRSVRLSLGDRELDLRVDFKWGSEPLPDKGVLSGFAFEDVSEQDELVLWDFLQTRGRELAYFMRTCTGLQALGFEDAFQLAVSTRLRHATAGQAVYRPQDACSSSIFALMRGGVVIEEAGALGPRRHLGNVRQGEVFGAMALMAGCEAFDNAFATEETLIVEFPSYTVEHLVATRPDLGIMLLRSISSEWVGRLRASARRAAASAAA